VHPKEILIADYGYVLPPERIAQHPLQNRDQSRLLLYDSGKISENTFTHLATHLPPNSTLIFNDTKVIHARIIFRNERDAAIEVFLLEPVEPMRDMQLAMFTHETCVWRCFIGNAKKWREECLSKKIRIGEQNIILEARHRGKAEEDFLVEFNWGSEKFSFAQILEAAGHVPLPPYIKRKSAGEDEDRYQTIYAVQDGSVAAPTAGLHFTEKVFDELKQKNIQSLFTTLHVSAGTFLPVKAAKMEEHHMHEEQIVIRKDFLEKLLEIVSAGSPIIAVGTTSLRTLESIYWIGKKISEGDESLIVNQWDPYETRDAAFTIGHSLSAILDLMKTRQAPHLVAETRLLIAPGYDFKFAHGLITNFHLPKSTLLLLIAAFIGDDWKKVYAYALENDFRFLSYGDGSLLWRKTA